MALGTQRRECVWILSMLGGSLLAPQPSALTQLRAGNSALEILTVPVCLFPERRGPPAGYGPLASSCFDKWCPTREAEGEGDKMQSGMSTSLWVLGPSPDSIHGAQVDLVPVFGVSSDSKGGE